MRRVDLQVYAEAKLNDAVLLLAHSRWSNAYYLAGYCIELALKACIARQISTDTIPDRSILTGVLNHDFDKLVGLAGLKADLKGEQDINPAFAANWAIVFEWKPDSRYQNWNAISAQLLVQAIADPNDGVLQWIRRFW